MKFGRSPALIAALLVLTFLVVDQTASASKSGEYEFVPNNIYEPLHPLKDHTYPNRSLNLKSVDELNWNAVDSGILDHVWQIEIDLPDSGELPAELIAAQIGEPLDDPRLRPTDDDWQQPETTPALQSTTPPPAPAEPLVQPSTTPPPAPAEPLLQPSTTPPPAPAEPLLQPSTTPPPAPAEPLLVPSTTPPPAPAEPLLQPSTTPPLAPAEPLLQPSTTPPPAPAEPLVQPSTTPPTPAPAPALEASPRDPNRPLPHPEVPELYQRVLTLPGATLYRQPWTEPPIGGELPAFTVLYVYHEVEQAGQRWVQVGADAFGATDGWLPGDTVEAWHSMLVMQFAPRGQRERVLFFRDHLDLIELVRSPWGAEEALATYEDIRGGTHDDQVYVAIEPAAAVTRDQLYLMPILAAQNDSFYNGAETTLLQVAGLNLGHAEPQTAVVEADRLGRLQPGLRDFKIGVTFVIDTTISMGPYIQETYQTVARILTAFAEADATDRVSFGLVGYRDDVSYNPAIDYVTRIYQPLDPAASHAALLDNLAKVRASSVPTADWDEDTFAGLQTAIEELDWAPFDLRLIVLITDAGPRLGTDPRALHRDLDAINVVEMANRKNIAIVPVHLRTPEAARWNNLDYAAEQYQRLARTGDFASSKYVGVETGSPEAFAAAIGTFADELVESLLQAQRGRLVEPREAAAAVAAPRSLGDILVNEIFRAQLEYLGRERGVEAPRFYHAWAADQDLVEPRRQALTVNVFLARNQLSALARSLDTIIEAAGLTAASPQAFFEELQLLAAATAVEGGGRLGGSTGGEVTGADLLPAFLRILPYRSKALSLDRQMWLDMGQTGQTEFLDELRAKRRAYREIYEATDNWIDLGAGDPALEVYPMALSLLP